MWMDRDSLALHASGLRTLARRLVRDDAAADDVVQDACLAALRKPPPAGVPLGRWLAGVVRNLAKRTHRANDRRARHEAGATEHGGAAQPPADEVVCRAESHRMLVNAVLALDEPYRSTILLRYFDGLSLRDIAVRMLCPVGTVGRRLHEGLRRLRARLHREHGRTWPLVLAGVTAMKKTIAIAAVLVALLATVFFVVNRSSDPGERTSDDSKRTAMSVPGAGVADGESASTEGDAARAIDRDLDLHGEVVDETGRPVAGAKLATFSNPWITFGWDMTNPPPFRDGPATTSAEDGSFALRLSRGEQVNLRVQKTGFASKLLWRVQAGARLRVVLGQGVALTVLVLDPDGHPAAGTRLRLQQLPPSGHDRVTGDATTGSDGRARFADLPPGGWCHIFGRHPQFGRVPWERRITFPAQGEHVVTVRIRPGRTLRGLVKDASTGKAVTDAEIDSGYTFDMPVAVSADGTFELRGWGAGKEFELNARAPGYARAKTALTVEDRIEIELEPERKIAGRIVDAQDRAVAGALVRARGNTAGRTSSRGRATSGADGRFLLVGLSPRAPHNLTVAASGFGKTFFLVAADAADAGDITLAAAHRVEGRVLWPDDSPAVGIKVTLESAASGTTEKKRGQTVTEERWTDDLGRFRFAGVGDGPQRLMAAPGGGKQVVHDFTLEGDDLIGHELGLFAKYKVTARVVFEDGHPVVGAQVMLRTKDKWTFDRATDTAGKASAFSDTPFVGVTQIYGFGRGDPFAFDGPVEIPEGKSDVEVRVRRAGIARGMILDPEGEPIAQANFEVFADGKPVSLGGPFGGNQGWTDMQGRFELTLPVGMNAEIRLTSFVNHFSKGQKRLPPFGGRLEDVRAGRTGLVLRAEPLQFDRPLLVQVLDPGGNPLPGAQVYAKLMGKNIPGANVITRAEGRATLRGLPEAKCWVNARVVPSHPESENWTAASLVVEPEGQEITLRLGRALWVRGVVVDAKGKPVAGAKAYAYHVQTQLGEAKTNAKGEFALKLRGNQKMPIGLLVVAGDKQKRIDPYTPPTGQSKPKPIRVVLK